MTPPHSENGKTVAFEGVASELSDLELDTRANASTFATQHQSQPQSEQPSAMIKEEEEVEPDHYYGGGKIPVFKPVSN